MLEGQLTREEEEQDDSEAPVVASLVVRLRREDFRCDVAGCSCDHR